MNAANESTEAGRVAIVTGSSRGVGRATAIELGKRGWTVVINCSRSIDEAEATARQIRDLGGTVSVVQADVGSEEDCRSLVDTTVRNHHRIDLLVNNAGTTDFLPFADLDKLTDDHWNRIFQVNVKGAFYCVRAARPFLEKAPGGGRIVNVTSVAGMIGNGSSIAYCASKAALINMTISLARALAPTIRVNSVAPGFIADDWTERGLGDRYAAARAGHERRAVLGRVCEPEDVAAAIVSLATGSRMVTGQNIVVDGGMTIGPR